MKLKTYCIALGSMAILLVLLPHLILNLEMTKLTSKIAIHERLMKKHTPISTVNMTEGLMDIQSKQRLLLQLFVLMSQTSIEWGSFGNEQNDMILGGKAYDFSEIKKFILHCQKNHIPLSLQKMQVNERIEFQLIYKPKKS